MFLYLLLSKDKKKSTKCGHFWKMITFYYIPHTFKGLFEGYRVRGWGTHYLMCVLTKIEVEVWAMHFHIDSPRGDDVVSDFFFIKNDILQFLRSDFLLLLYIYLIYFSHRLHVVHFEWFIFILSWELKMDSDNQKMLVLFTASQRPLVNNTLILKQQNDVFPLCI